MSVKTLPSVGSHLCTVDLYRDPSGEVRAEVSFMPPRLIETTGSEVVDRMQIIAGWLDCGARQIRETWGLANDR